MPKKYLLATLAILASSSVLAGDAYTKLDADKSGSISVEEAAALPGLSDQWKTLDADADGTLNVEEFARFETKEIKEMKKTKEMKKMKAPE